MDPETITVPERGEDQTCGDRPARAPAPRQEPRWPIAALVGAFAVNGLWVALLLWLIAHWAGAG